VCDAKTFTLNDAEDDAICDSWQKNVEKGDNLQLKKYSF
jgi:hypothetical protein